MLFVQPRGKHAPLTGVHMNTLATTTTVTHKGLPVRLIADWGVLGNVVFKVDALRAQWEVTPMKQNHHLYRRMPVYRPGWGRRVNPARVYCKY